MRFLAKNSNFTPLFLGYGRIFGSFSLFYAHVFGIFINFSLKNNKQQNTCHISKDT